MRLIQTLVGTFLTLVLCTGVSVLAAPRPPVVNTAQLSYQVGNSPQTLSSNTVQLDPISLPTPAHVTFWRVATGVATAQPTPIDRGQCFSANGSMSALSLNIQSSQSVNAANAPILQTGSFRAGEPVVIYLEDGNRNNDPAARETIDLEVTTSNGDREKLRLTETDINSAIFTAVIPSVATPPAPTQNDCTLSVAQGVELQARYVDSFFPTDIATATVLIDPFGIVFNSSNGEPVSGVRITIIDVLTGLPATVYGDDQVSTYPATVTTGQSVTDSNGNIYTYGPGAFRFPYLAPGQYRFAVTAPADFIVPSAVDAATLRTLRSPAGGTYEITTGSFADTFALTSVEPVRIDIPIDPAPGTLILQKQASVTTASAGDYIQYRLTLQNRNRSTSVRNVLITDSLPVGLRYRKGTLRVENLPVVDPAQSRNGQTLSIPVASLAASATANITYVLQVVSSAPVSEAINRAIARTGRDEASNEARAAVRIERPFFSDRLTIIGRIVEDQGQCRTPAKELTGVSNIRVLMEDGTFVSSDSDGMFHFEGVRAGTHVVQLDLASLPVDLEPVSCIRNTRFARRAYSQFVDARGGSLWRTDFYLRRKTAPAQKISISAERANSEPAAQYQVKLLNETAQPLNNVRVFLQLPEKSKPVSLAAGQSFEFGVATLPVENIAAGSGLTAGLAVNDKEAPCGTGRKTAKAFALFDLGTKKSIRTPTVEITVPCVNAQSVAASSTGHVDIPEDKMPTAVPVAPVSDATAAGADMDWFAGQSAGTDILFPTLNHNPRAPVIRVVIKHAPGEKISLTLNGGAVDGLRFDGTDMDAAQGVAISKWRGLPLQDGDNEIVADIRDSNTAVIKSLKRIVHYANLPAHAELITAHSRFVADGRTQPVLAVRLTDRFGKPVRQGVTGAFELEQPYTPAQSVDDKNRRQLDGTDHAANMWRIEGDDGIARIALEPTTQAGTAVVHFNLGDERARTRETLRAWLEPQLRDWVVVGFAKGTIGFNDLAGNIENVADPRSANDSYTDGQISLYAKGRVKGKWLLTLAYDSDKKRGKTANERELLRVIDPNRYYTLYGDQTQQGYDAASLERIYLKLERNQFYAMFGDFETGLNQNELSRYSRSFNGVKTEYRSAHFNVNAFAARSLFNFARDELQGTGLSTFYRLSKNNIILNSDKITVETRDRFRSERIVETKSLVRHIDYDIDYEAGTLTFREPIRSRDSNFNPIFIVVDYETLGAAGHDTNAGGRLGAAWQNGRVEAGATVIHDEGLNTKTNLGGLDVNARLSENTQVRAEAARTHRQNAQGVDKNGNAYLAEIEHRSARADALAYYRRQEGGFGLGQQNGVESGTQKYGLDGRVRLAHSWQIAGSAYRENYFQSGANRIAAQSRLEYVTDTRSLFAGFQFASDDIPGQSSLTSKLVTLGGSQRLLDRKLELQAQTDFSLGGGSESFDYPTRHRVGATYAVNDNVNLLLSHEITNGRQFDSATTRFGLDATVWKGARLASTLNQARISEYGPRTFAQFGLSQKLALNERWTVDFGVDSNQTFNKRVTPVQAINLNQPLASGGALGDGGLIDDFVAASTGFSFHNEILSWNARAEFRDGQQANRYALSSNILRQTSKGVALSGFGQYLRTTRSSGQQGTLATIGAGVAYRPLGSRWSILNKLEFKSDVLTGGIGNGLLGFNSVQGIGDLKNQRIVNNLAINRVSRAWRDEDHDGNKIDLNQRTQWSLYYASKYSFDTFNTVRASGYTHMLGVELRHDISPNVDIGIQASLLHSVKAKTLDYSIGPQIGFSPFTNGWITAGYNVIGFRDRDFSDSNYTQKGPYIALRLKFDQESLGLAGSRK